VSARPTAVRPSLTWLTIRVTAVVLAVLVLAHFAATHLLTDVADTDSTFVAARWQSGLIAATDWLMLVCAVLHGIAGAWTIASEYLRSTRARAVARIGLTVAGIAMVAGGTWTLLVLLGRPPQG
jgi:succinate dehydrogenase hydrophobic anchor subunit